MEVLLGVLGGVLVVAAAVDSLWTTLWTDGGGGPLTTTLSRGVWRTVTALPDRLRHVVLRGAGPLLILAAVGLWVGLLLTGWWLIFLAGETAVVDATTRVPADGVSRLYFVGYGLFTLGVGDYIAQGDGWQLATIVLTATGLFHITLAITYLMQVVSAVVDKRAFASGVHALGSLPHEVVASAWDGSGFPALDQRLLGFTDQLGRLTEQHLAYPVLHYVHTEDLNKASSVAVAVLDDAVTLLVDGVAPGARPSPTALVAARRSITSFLDTVVVSMPGEDAPTPPSPNLSALRAEGIPTVDDRSFATQLVAADGRRRQLNLLVRDDARRWPGTR